MNKILSICIPTFNRINHIKRLIEFLLQEVNIINTKDIEVIISNNCSDDGTTFFLNSLPSYDWLKIYNQEINIGAFNNFQFLLKCSKGEYYWMPGDDDYLKTGIIRDLLRIINSEKPNYIYIRNCNIIEKTKDIIISPKFNRIQYDKSLYLDESTIAYLLENYFGNFKFQTSSVFRRENAIIYNNDATRFPLCVQEDCHSIYKVFRSMQSGSSYFISDIKILNGDEILWKDQLFNYTFKADPLFCDLLISDGIPEQISLKIKNMQYASGIFTALFHPFVFAGWKEMGFPGLSCKIIPLLLKILNKKINLKIYRKMHKSYLNKESFLIKD